MTNCGSDTSMVWAVIVGAVALLIAYGIVSSHLKTLRKRRIREKTVPFTEYNVQRGRKYNVFLANGVSYRDVEVVGTTDPDSGQFSLGGYDGMLVLQRTDSRKVFVRATFVRFIEET
jgi:hypothetical protein